MNRFQIRSLFMIPALACGLLLGSCREPSAPTTPSKTEQPVTTPKAPLVEKQQVADWCPEHGVPESICTRCNAPLIAGFKAKGDWCNKHDLPDSQCFICHPELEAKFKAMAPKSK